MRWLHDSPLRVRIGPLGLFSFFGWFGTQASHTNTQRAIQERLLISRIFVAHFDAKLAGQKAMVERAAPLLGVSVDLMHNYFDPFLVVAQELGPTSHAELVDQSGLVIGDSGRWRLFFPGEHADFYRPPLTKLNSVWGSTPAFVDPSSGRGIEPLIMTFVPLTEAPWGLSLGATQEEMLASAQEWQGQVLLLAGVLLGAALVLGWFTIRHVIGPMKLLIPAAERMAKGDLEFFVPATGKDELCRFTQAFEGMRTGLKASREDMTCWNEGLERKLKRQTSEVADLFAA